MTPDTKRLHAFISHYHKDDTHIDKLTNLLKSRGYDVRNSSIRANPKNQERLRKGLVKEETIRRFAPNEDFLGRQGDCADREADAFQTVGGLGN